MLTDREIVAALVAGGENERQAMRRVKERDEHLRVLALRSKSRRDRIATAALHALLVKSEPGTEVKPADFAQGAVAQADALIAELDK